MATSKKSSKPTPPPQNNNAFYIALILISLAVNGYFLLHKQDKKDQPLVKVGAQTFRWKDISATSKVAMADLDRSYYSLLRREADAWVESRLLPEEAQALSTTVSDLLKKEVGDKTQVSQEDVYRRYVRSPRADASAWPQVLAEIEKELRREQYQEHKQKYLEGLYPKYGVDYLLKPPQRDMVSPVRRSLFPVYSESRATAPSRGASNAPVLLEVFSDFMCPYSVKFNSTVQELQKQYPDKIRTTFRQFPLPFHNGAHLMAEASLCAEEQGKFWEYHDKLMAEAKKREKAELVQIAADLQLSTPQFVDCLDSGRFVKKVDTDIAIGKANGVQGTPGFLINGRLGSGAKPTELMKPLIDWHLNPSGVYPGKPQQPANRPGNGAQGQPMPGVDPAKVYPLDAQWLKKGFVRGSDDAPVTLVEFFDYNCPFCRKGAEVADALSAEYGTKLKVVSKHNPLPMHANAAKTSEALLCAHEQSKFMELRKEILGDSWGKNSVDELKTAAKKVGLNETAFNACLDGGKTKAVIDEDMKTAAAMGVQSTPTFMVNGTPVIGAQPIEVFKKIIDEKLSDSKK
jgi:protein-disulfide isomerase